MKVKDFRSLVVEATLENFFDIFRNDSDFETVSRRDDKEFIFSLISMFILIPKR